MVVDHAADMLWQVRIAPDTLRIATRLAMPLFCMLTGYLLYRSRLPRVGRLGQVVVASILANIVYWSLYQRLEILASILLAFVIYFAVRRWMPVCILLVLLARVDPSGALLDYPLLVVTSCIAAGSALRWASDCKRSVAVKDCGSMRFRNHALVVLAWFFLAASSAFVPRPTAYVLWFVPVAGMLIWAAASKRLVNVVPLEFLGRYPLTAYVLQYFVLWGLSRAIAT